MRTLEPNEKVERCKSFYKKAMIDENENGCTLYSYGTPVMMSKDGEFYRIWLGWSNTTARHIKSFCANFGEFEMNKSKFENLRMA